MKNPKNPPKPSSSSSKPPAAMALRKSRWDPPTGGCGGGDKPAAPAPAPAAVGIRTPTPSSDTRHPPPHPPALAPNPASPAAALRPPAETVSPPPYGFHNLERRTVLLADGTVRSYFALPPDYPFDQAPFPPHPHLSRGPEFWAPPQPPPPSLAYDGKRKHPADPDDGLPRHPKQLRIDEPPRPPHVDHHALRSAYLKYAKMLNESAAQRKNYLEGGRATCLACNRSSKDFADVHGLIMHAYNPPHADSFVDHLGLHKALCVLMGWDYTKVPENSKTYQSLSADRARANREDLIVWPPTVIIHNTSTGRKKDGRFEGLGNREMDIKIKELGFSGGKAKSLYGKEGHLGLTLVKFANNQAGLKEAERLAGFFEREDHGRVGWSQAHASQSIDSDKNPLLVKDDRTGEKKRIFYGYLAIATDLDKLDSDTRKRASLKSRMEFDPSD